ncbi:MAG: General secretion [Candidatus Curtissbacteria bacterium GW2011_GWA1_40_9]|uniref:General secretion n=1 Tax=Candidatus Curtissbacteria bacterium GW2011_GWA1_40_9 TaxID=1618408 RepID=A0A0G0TMR4_9BACT|nr:MAG: General secretion [Candidatus Curtissbacteria bacterium GW2011_GWA1_40_9]
MFIKPVQKKFKGFTLIELLVVIAILGILAAAVLVAINPGKRTRQAQDAKRKNDIGAIATEVQGYFTTPGSGLYPGSLYVLTAQSYLKQMPYDPTAGTGTDAYGYSVNGTTTEAAVWATLAEPTTGSNPAYLWCYQTSSGVAREILTNATGDCTP